jgi:superoxide reductase
MPIPTTHEGAIMADLPHVTLVSDFAAAGDFEKKHTPFIMLEAQGDLVVVNVEVGHEVPHPNGADHYITSIELFAGGATIARLDLAPVVTNPRFCVPVSLPAGTVIRAVEHCNLHGWWAYEVTL